MCRAPWEHRKVTSWATSHELPALPRVSGIFPVNLLSDSRLRRYLSLFVAALSYNYSDIVYMSFWPSV
jgi:hypothetical protein